MKKTLLAVAALGAFASAAQAQSSVTVYGILDVGYIGSNFRAANNGATNNYNPNTAAGNNAGGVVKTTTNSFSDSAESTSRIGFKGNEDLGGGLSAFFTIENAVSPNGATGAFSASASGNRQTFAGLKKSGLGNFSFGTQYTSIHNAVAASDPGNQNNMMGNVIYDKWAGISSTQTGTNYGTGTTLQWNAGNQNNTSYTVRQNNMLRVESDTFSGFKANGFAVMNNSQNTQVSATVQNAAGNTIAQAGGVVNTTGWGLGADYVWQKAFLTANYQTFKQQTTPTAITNLTPAACNVVQAGAQGTNACNTVTPSGVIGGYAGGDITGTNSVDTQQYYAGTYDFGILKAYAQYINRKVVASYNANSYLTRTAEQIGVRSYITPTIESWASVGMGKINTTGVGGQSAKITGYQLGANYWLSKRTNLYAIYGQQGTSNIQLNSYNTTAISNQNPTSYNANNYALGLRHTF